MAISRSKVKIYMVDATDAKGLDPGTITDTELIAGEIVNYGKTGGGSDTESVPAFGGFIDKEKPEEQFEISMEVVPNLLTAEAAIRWETFKYAADTTNAGVYTSASGSGSAVPAGKKVIIIESEGALNQTYAFNNCDVTQFELDHSADDNRTGNITFKFSPQTTDGSPNLQVVSGVGVLGDAAALIDWASLDK